MLSYFHYLRPNYPFVLVTSSPNHNAMVIWLTLFADHLSCSCCRETAFRDKTCDVPNPCDCSHLFSWRQQRVRGQSSTILIFIYLIILFTRMLLHFDSLTFSFRCSLSSFALLFFDVPFFSLLPESLQLFLVFCSHR